MAKQTVQGLMLERMDRLERKMDEKLDYIIPILEGLKVKSAIAGGLAGIVATGLVTVMITAFK